MTTQHFSHTHTDETGKTTLTLAALIDGAFHAMPNALDPEALAQLEDACRFLAEDDAALALSLDSGATVRKVDADALLPTLVAEHEAAKDAEHDAYTRYFAASHTTRVDLWQAYAEARYLTKAAMHKLSHLMAPGGRAQVTLTIGRETRTIGIRTMADIDQPERATSDDFCGAYQKGPGCKVWEERISFWAKDGRWEAARQTTLLNRAGYQLIGWAGTMPKAAISQHNSAI